MLKKSQPVILWLEALTRYPKEDCGARKVSRFGFSLPRSLAVKLLLPSWTSRVMLSTRTIAASSLFRTWALTEGHTVRTKALKFLPVM